MLSSLASSSFFRNASVTLTHAQHLLIQVDYPPFPNATSPHSAL